MIQRRIFGAVWLILSVLALVFFKNAHITVAAIAGILFAACLILVGWKDSRDAKFGSFVWGWAAFYVLSASFIILYVWAQTGFLADAKLSPFNGPLWYHLLANIALLGLFWFKLDRIHWAVRGWWTAMILSPLMFLIVWLGRGFLEPPQFIGGFFLLGAALLVVDLIFLRKMWELPRVIKTFRTGSQIILWVFLLVFVFLLGLALASVFSSL